ncbi:MAG: GreA/GreB family elongation factor [Flavobacteriales bacterium]|nr:GreA/GreB family elongation factor [Flavobacteriales bacterium]MCL4281242.1 GreA/GreB family elongation factor [Flavobacteriales bacterium]
MANPKLIITARDRDLLQEWIAGFTPPDLNTSKSLAKLSEELKQADIRAEKDLPADVVRVGSVVTFRSPSIRKENLQLVLPKDADLKANKLSAFSVMGSALIGYRQGMDITWTLPKGEETIHLERVDNSKGYALPDQG